MSGKKESVQLGWARSSYVMFGKVGIRFGKAKYGYERFGKVRLWLVW